MLEEFGVPLELTVISAHRTPERMMEYARTAPQRGLRVIIAGAGGVCVQYRMCNNVRILSHVATTPSLPLLACHLSLPNLIRSPCTSVHALHEPFG